MDAETDIEAQHDFDRSTCWIGGGRHFPVRSYENAIDMGWSTVGVGGIRPEHGLLLGLRLRCGLADRVICGERTLTGLQGEHRFDEDPAVVAVPR